MSKISILSFPRYYNYGTFLQLYALQTAISKLGHQAELIDYDPYNDSGKKTPNSRKLATKLKRLIGNLTTIIIQNAAHDFTVDKSTQKEKFSDFSRQHLNLGKKTYFTASELEQQPPQSDAYIVGSDQVWHPKGHHKDSAYFLSFAQRSKRIAYAPSFGVSEVPEDTKAWLKTHIEAIPNLSIREKSGASIIKSLTGKEAQVVADPAYLLSRQEWEQLVGKEKLIPRPYMLCYFLESDSYMRKTAARIANERGLELFFIPVHAVDSNKPIKEAQYVDSTGPKEFVKLIRDADFVCTDSFHGTSFSLIFNKQFLTFKRHNNAEQAANHGRLQSILSEAGLVDRIIDKRNCEDAGNECIEFEQPNARVDRLKQSSMNFLKQSLDRVLVKQLH